MESFKKDITKSNPSLAYKDFSQATKFWNATTLILAINESSFFEIF